MRETAIIRVLADQTEPETSKETAGETREAEKGSQLVGFGHELVGVGRARHGRLRSAAAQPRFPRLAGSSS